MTHQRLLQRERDIIVTEQFVHSVYGEVTMAETHPGCKLGLAAGGRILLVTMLDASRQGIDAWVNYSMTVRKDWLHPNVLSLVDMTAEKAGPTPYMQKRTKDIFAVRPELKTYIAIVLNRGPVGIVVRATVRTANTPMAQYQAFFSSQEALNWLSRQGELR